tara:strand:+ start:1048 stop:1299 length:252 start_codon:yes stop_codon:yes gene_type:complete
MNFIKEEKDVLFLSLNNIIKDYEVWNRLETNDKYHFLTSYKKLAKNDNSNFNISNKLHSILKDYNEEFLYNEVFLSKKILALL